MFRLIDPLEYVQSKLWSRMCNVISKGCLKFIHESFLSAARGERIQRDRQDRRRRQLVSEGPDVRQVPDQTYPGPQPAQPPDLDLHLAEDQGHQRWYSGASDTLARAGRDLVGE